MIDKTLYTIENNKIAFLEVGDKNNPIVFFLHGIPASAELWSDTMEAVAEKGFYCLAPYLAGYGDTKVTDEEHYNLTSFSELLTSLIKENNWTNINLVGHDIGGGIAQIMMTKEPTIFKQVILSNCITDDTWPIPDIEKMVKVARLGLFYWMARLGFFQKGQLYKSLSKPFFRNQLSESDFSRIFYDGKFKDKQQIKRFQKMLKALDSKHTIANMVTLKESQLPVQLIWGMNDKFQPWEKAGIKLQSTFSNCKAFQIQKCGHFLQIDAFEEYKDLLIECLS